MSADVEVEVTCRATLKFSAEQWRRITDSAQRMGMTVEDFLANESGTWWRRFSDECDDIDVEVQP